MSKWVLAIVLSIVAVVPVAYFAYLYVNFEEKATIQGVAVIDYMSREQKAMEPGSEFRIRSCHVLDGYKFAVLLENGEWINAHLPVATNQEATKMVVDLLKQSQAPSVVLRRKLDDYWIVNFHLTLDGKEIMLRDLLNEHGMIL